MSYSLFSSGTWEYGTNFTAGVNSMSKVSIASNCFPNEQNTILWQKKDVNDPTPSPSPPTLLDWYIHQIIWYTKWAASWQNQQNDCDPSEDSDQPGHQPSLIESSLSAWRKLGQRTAKILIRLGGCPGWSESSLGAQSHCWFCHEAAQI